MDLLATDDQLELAKTARQVLRDVSPFELIRTAGVSGAGAPEDTAWARLTELGWFAMGVPEDAGGGGFDLCDQIMVARELGRVLAPVAALSTMIAAKAAARHGASD